MIKVTTTSGNWERFLELIVGFLAADVVRLSVNSKPVSGYRSPDNPALWIRDHSDTLRAGQFLLADIQSAVSCFAESQAANGRIHDFVTTNPVGARENWEEWVRIPVEADVEFRFVKAAFLAWQASGDDTWIKEIIPALERALTYTSSHPNRWDPRHELVKRPYTIDTWDFDYTAGRHPWLNFQITDHTYWGIFHGDNSGLYESALHLAQLYEEVDSNAESAERWKSFASGLKERANKLLFNGRFYTHFHKLNPVSIPGVDESSQLSMSNPAAISRGMATPEICQAILSEYRERAKEKRSFAEWWGIDPPFPVGVFGDNKIVPGTYINGGIFPLCGGDLANAAFSNGHEAYGVDTLKKYRELIQKEGQAYLWYTPTGHRSTVPFSTSPQATPTDGWGSSSMLHAFTRGLCGLVDHAHSFERVTLSPRWATTDETDVSVWLTYAASEASVAYRFHHDTARSVITVDTDAKESHPVKVRLLLPPDTKPADADVTVEEIGESIYACFDGAWQDSFEVGYVSR